MTQIGPLPYHHATVWVVVADGCHASVYARVPSETIVMGDTHQPEDLATWALQPIDTLTLEGELTHFDPASPGRGGNIHRASRRYHDRDHEEIRFAPRLAEWLNTAKIRGGFDNLVIVAPPPMLGALRPHLDTPVREAVLQDIAKDFMNLSVKELTDRMRDLLPARDGGSHITPA